MSVVTTPFTFVATIEAILLAGAKPNFADIDRQTLNIDPDSAAQAIRKDTVALLPVDIAGHPADYGALRRIAGTHSLHLISDAAHAIAGHYRDRSSAHFTDAAVYSCYSTKNLTCGEGGLVATRRKTLASKIRRLSTHGLTSGSYERKQAGRWDYDVLDFGFKANLSDVNAAIGLGQLSILEQHQVQRQKLAQRYLKNLAHLSEYLGVPSVAQHMTHGWHLFIIQLKLPRLRLKREHFLRLMDRQGIECGVHYKPVFDLTYYRRALQLKPRDYPIASQAGRSVVTLPLYPALRLSDVDYVCDAVSRTIMKHRR